MKKPVKIELPKSVRVGCYDFALDSMTEREAEASREFGHMDFHALTIRLAAGQNLQQLVNTVVHEVMHAINRVYGADDDSDEETFVTQGANGWCQVWRDNPALIAWIAAGLNVKPPSE